MTSRLHVLVLPSWLECQWSKGGTFFVEQAAIMQALAGWQIRMLMACVHHIGKIVKDKLPQARGVEVVCRDGVEMWFGYYPYYLPRSSARAKMHFAEKLFLEYVAKHGKPDFLWVQSISHAGYVARHLSGKYRIPYFILEHSTKFMSKKLRDSACKNIRAVVQDAVGCAAVSDDLRHDMLRQIDVDKNKIGVVHNPVGMIFANAKTASRLQNPFVFISTAYLRDVKNIDLIIRAFAKVHDEVGNAKLLIVGDGAMKNSLQALVQELSLQDVIIFAGLQNREQLCKHLQAADAFVAASNYETFGLALIEALMCGLPTITPAVGIASTAIDENNGVLLESLSGIAAAMQQVMQTRYDAALIQQKAQEQFSPETFAQQVQEIVLR